MFFKGSRYERVPAKDFATDDGQVIRYKALRMIPSTPGLTKHVVDEGDIVPARLEFAQAVVEGLRPVQRDLGPVNLPEHRAGELGIGRFVLDEENVTGLGCHEGEHR